MNKKRAKEIASKCNEFRVAVIGDFIFDRYIWGHARRISPEAPVPIVNVDRKTSTLGGAANVLRNISSLGAKAVAFGVLGNDRAGDEVLKLCRKWGIDTDGIIRDNTRKTTLKTRLIADGQQIARIDEEKDTPISESSEDQLIANLSKAIEDFEIHGLIIEDYNKGVISDRIIEEIGALNRMYGIPLALDPHPGNLLDVKGLTLMTPNRVEAFNLVGEYYAETVFPLAEDEKLQQVAIKILNRWVPSVLLITLGQHGMALFDKDGVPIHIPTAAKEVFDVSGAGDTVIATYFLSFLAGATTMEAAELANIAAGLVVGHVGTVPVDVKDLISMVKAR